MAVIPPYVKQGDVVFRVRPRLDHVDQEDKVIVSQGTVTGGGDIYVLVKWGNTARREPVREPQRNVMYSPRSEADALQQYVAWCDERLGSLHRQIVQVERLRGEALSLLDVAVAKEKVTP